MDLLNLSPDHLQCEIADQIAKEKQPLDELQLAALLGKTLLEKNGTLELKLMKLQEFAEDTLATNQSLMRQLAEAKDSLQFSNHLCEQLEVKVEELESSNEQLTKLCWKRRVLLEQKSYSLASVEQDLASARNECDHVRADLKQLQREGSEEGKESSSQKIHIVPENESKAEKEETTRVREEIEALTTKLQSADFQKHRLEREIANITKENINLGKNLDKAETELAELQMKFVELTESSLQNTEAVPITPCPAISPNRVTPSSPHRSSFVFPSQTSPVSNETGPSRSTTTAAGSPHNQGNENSQSLFSELDAQYSGILQSYRELLCKCTCSASLGHTAKQESVATSAPSNGLVTVEKGEGHGVGGAFKELFEEMFATLRQTAAVADRLIEKRVTKKQEQSD